MPGKAAPRKMGDRKMTRPNANVARNKGKGPAPTRGKTDGARNRGRKNNSASRLQQRALDVYAEAEADQNEHERRVLAHRSGGGGSAESMFHADATQSFDFDVDHIDSDDDEEISEDDAFNSDDEKRYGAFFESSGLKRATATEKGSASNSHNNDLDADDNSDDDNEDSASGSGSESEYDDGFGELGDSSTKIPSKDLTNKKPSSTTSKTADDVFAALDSDMDSSDLNDSDNDSEEEKKSTKQYGITERTLESASDDEEDSSSESGKSNASDSNGDLLASLSNKLKWGNDSDNESAEATNEDSVSLGTLLSGLKEDTGFGELKKKLEHIEKPKTKKVRVIDAPLPKLQVDKLEREVAYDKSKSEISKWTQAVKRHREAEHLSFPMDAPVHLNQSSAAIVSRFVPTTEMEKEVSAILDSANLTENLERQSEELAMKELSVEDIEERRQELQKLRALLFYKEQRQKKVSKIKSKTYRKIHRKEKEKKMSVLEEAMAEDDPEAAEESKKTEEFERILERMSLKHKNTGKWAKRAASMANRDPNAQRAIQEQLNRAEELQKKIAGDGESEESSDDEDSSMHNQLTKISELESEIESSGVPTKGVYGMKFMQRALSRDKAELKSELSHLKEVINGDVDDESAFDEDSQIPTEDLEIPQSVRDVLKRAEDGVLFENANGPVSMEIQDELKNSGSKEKYEYKLPAVAVAPTEPSIVEDNKEPSRKKAKKQSTTTTNNDAREFNSMSTKDILAMAFDGDELIDEFEAEKQKVMERDMPQEEDLTLPGWGSWGGDDLPVPKKKVVKKPSAAEVSAALNRKDKKLKHVIINEKRQKKMAKYLVASVPHGFDSLVQYEKSIRGALGNEFVTAESHGKAIMPKVRTKLGTIIAPMSGRHKSN